MRLLLAANNQATRQRNYKKLPSTSFNWVQAATDMHPACPNKKPNHLQNSLLRRTQFWVRKSFSKPASLKRASLVALPVAISHKASLKPNVALLQPWYKKPAKNEPKHGPKNGTAWRSHFWDRMHSLVKEQKKSTFTVPFLGPSGGTKNETAKSQNQQQRPTNKKWQLRLVSNKHIELEQRRPAHAKPDFNWLSGPRNGTWKRTCGISCLCSLAPMRRLQCSTTQATFTNPSLLRAYSATPWHVLIQLPNVIDTISKGWRSKKAFNTSPFHIFP